MKKIIAMLTAMVVGLGLGACSSTTPPGTGQTGSSVQSGSNVQPVRRGPDSPKEMLYRKPANSSDATFDTKGNN